MTTTHVPAIEVGVVQSVSSMNILITITLLFVEDTDAVDHGSDSPRLIVSSCLF